MKLHAHINDLQSDIQIRDEDSRVAAEIDGRRYELDVHDSGANNFLLIADGRVFDCRVEGRPESGKPVGVVVGTTRYEFTLIDPKRLRGASVAGAHADGATRIVAPMPGKVVRVLVKVGDQIAAGSGLLVVEAMKMQNEMKSPKAGIVMALNYEVGSTVNGGDVLAVVE